ncbi:MAG: DNA polymerase domain-containing protein [Herbinix sp.]|nr:DNA polymerase domain-containing protein [Herbinix sp.]
MDNTSYFYDKWSKEQTKRLMLRFPDIDKSEIEELVKNSYEERLDDGEVVLVNNYINRSFKMTMLTLIHFIEEKKPIMGGYGVLYRNQNEVKNPTTVVIRKFLDSRAAYKKELELYKEDSYEYKNSDRMQLNEKVNVNSLYGAIGTMAFFLFNLFVAGSVTATGQALISTMLTTYENFLSGTVRLNNIDDVYQFIRNVERDYKSMEHKLDKFIEDVSVDDVFNKIRTAMSFNSYDSMNEVLNILYNLDQGLLNLLYYKNNIYEFIKIPKITKLIEKIIIETESFKDPNKIPPEAKDDIDDLWKYIEKYVFYNYLVFDKIQRAKTDSRNVVVVTDTDSTMLNLGPWYDFVNDNIVENNPELLNQRGREQEYIILNLMCSILTRVSKSILTHYCKVNNILEDYRHMINAKNEFLFSIMILAQTKKRYISSVRLREGREFTKEKLDIKGHDFIKSSTTPQTKKYFEDIIKEELIGKEDINPHQILKKAMLFDRLIKESLMAGEKDFLVPKSVKEFSAYKPDQLYKEQGVRAILAWDAVYPDLEFELPAKFYVVKTRMETLDKIEPLKLTEPKIYEALKKGIFENSNEKISSKGVTVIAIPRNVEKIPSWIIPYIDYDTMISDNINKSLSLLTIFSFQTISTSRNKYISNIISI